VRNSDDPKQDSGNQTAGFPGQAQREAESQYGPFRDVGLSIFLASSNCLDALKPWIEAPDETRRQQIEFQLFNEFLFFFTHMTTRRITGYVGDALMDKLVSYLGGAIPSVAVESYFSTWPIDSKNQMAKEFVDLLNEAEQQYTAIAATGKIMPVLMLLTRHVFEMLGMKEVDETKASEVLKSVARQLDGIDIDQLILNLKQLEN
jgi:hypothetical protein